MDSMEQPEPKTAGHYYALQVGSVFLTGYYNVLTNQPHLANQFYTDNSSVVRLDCETGRWSFGETVEVINDMMMSMKLSKVEVKTANFLESWAGAITLLVTGLVKLKHYPVRKRFAQNIVLAPKEDGYFIFSDIFKLICDEYDDQYPFADYNCADNMPQVEASYTMAEIGSDYLDGEPEAQETVDPAENHVQHQDYLEYKAGNVIDDETHLEEHIPPFPSSTDVKRDSPLALPHPPSPTLEEPVEEAPKTYASVLRTKSKATLAITESQQAQQLAQQPQSASVHEKSNLDNHRDVSVPEDEGLFPFLFTVSLMLLMSFYWTYLSVRDLLHATEFLSFNGQSYAHKMFLDIDRFSSVVHFYVALTVWFRFSEEFLSVYVGNLSPSTSVFDLEKVFQAFGRIKPDGVAIRSRKASPVELNGRFVHVEERRPNCGFPRGRRGRGRADFSRDQAGGRYDGEYATRSKGIGHQKKTGRQYDSYY
ncbi:Nuclear transport factor 2 (NTF2) family protein with RNA binding (RRM-RBD-RNP motifs) domain [Zea mays]|uniref:Nuclear transport factor 2 (NTF2) family protein with RNA binding (RRM-RBD-RNP motifs) domain n=1 Tax=Zea mays TaxID=4577 RepID=A0A1D6E634_MAIZE|nr:Nuclear transport factor 2 (NTF2) family protein with RNA binding (RRM-RBD-RNP motifs) domain [Zea mays]